jgi:hypothetical protein
MLPLNTISNSVQPFADCSMVIEDLLELLDGIRARHILRTSSSHFVKWLTAVRRLRRFVQTDYTRYPRTSVTQFRVSGSSGIRNVNVSDSATPVHRTPLPRKSVTRKSDFDGTPSCDNGDHFASKYILRVDHRR